MTLEAAIKCLECGEAGILAINGDMASEYTTLPSEDALPCKLEYRQTNQCPNWKKAVEVAHTMLRPRSLPQ
jgi:hypothetical protein